jgi:hypothetical protein
MCLRSRGFVVLVLGAGFLYMYFSLLITLPRYFCLCLGLFVFGSRYEVRERRELKLTVHPK